MAVSPKSTMFNRSIGALQAQISDDRTIGKLDGLEAKDFFRGASKSILPASQIAKKALANRSWYEKWSHILFQGGIDPYVVVTLCQDVFEKSVNVKGKQKDRCIQKCIFTHRTKIVYGGGPNVIFESKHDNNVETVVSWTEGNFMKLKVLVWDRDLVTADDLIGMTMIDITNVFRHEGKLTRFYTDLEYLGEGEVKLTGDIEVHLLYKNKILSINIIAIANLKIPKPAHLAHDASYFKASSSVLILIVYLGIGLWYYSVFENWSILDILYFSFICLTTVGYGDHAEFKRQHSYFFTSMYMLAGFSFAAMAFSLLITYVINHMHHEAISLFIEPEKMYTEMYDHVDSEKKKKM